MYTRLNHIFKHRLSAPVHTTSSSINLCCKKLVGIMGNQDANSQNNYICSVFVWDGKWDIYLLYTSCELVFIARSNAVLL